MIYVITHKCVNTERIDRSCYSILHVGENNNYEQDYLLDSVGDNISFKNSNYCELTGLYWIWKNGLEKQQDITGLVHYRRFFTTRKEELLYNYFAIQPSILSTEVIKKDLQKVDIIVPRKRKSLKTVSQTYAFFHDAQDLVLMEEIINRVCPQYSSVFVGEMNSHSYYCANMMICRKEILDQYSSWLFKLLEEYEKEINISKYENEYQARVFGFIAERLLQVWIKQNGFCVKERSIFNTEKRGETLWGKTISFVSRLF